MDNLRLYMITYNVATKHPEQNLDCLLGFQLAKANESLPDLYVVGEVLASRDYVKVKTVRLQGTVISLFCLRKHLLHLRDIETQYTKTGFGGMWGNKGAVSIRLSIYGCSVCLVNCHLTPHDHLLQERVTDYNTIIKSQSFQAKETTNILYHDYVFWIGDLNFRLLSGLSATEIEQLVEKGELTRLLAKDQLRHVIDTGEAFSELVENLPTFPPTYKFEFHTSKYDLKRRPSWTDRILHKVNANVYENLTLQAEQLSYNSLDYYTLSDHKPVVAEFIIKVFSNYFERVIEFQPLDTWYIDEENYASYTLSGDVEPTMWDWIGVFKDGFTSLEEYLCYVYAMRGTNNTNTARSRVKTVVFPITAVRTPGQYRLLYFSNNSGSVLGMSEAFRAVNRQGTSTISQLTYSDGFQ
uniref:Inositol polyphosphate-related phosphatase domain-containing protein n=1 Tax=Timema genevievae TaxID=629358 RepID=A0A7R9JS33_TIMGE|nr:unnamed protein product [Timema genevievae]